MGIFNKSKKGTVTPEAQAAFLQFVKAIPDRGAWSLTLSDIPPAKMIMDSEPTLQRDIVMLAAAQGRIDYDVNNHIAIHHWGKLVGRLIARKLPFSDADICKLIATPDVYGAGITPGMVIKILERRAQDGGLPDDIRKKVRARRGHLTGSRSTAEQVKRQQRIADLLGEVVESKFEIDTDEPWADRLTDDVAQLDDQPQAAMNFLLAHAATADGGKPAKKWLAEASNRMQPLDDDLVRSALIVWLAAFDQQRSQRPNQWQNSYWLVADVNATLMKGMLWIAALIADDDLIRAISKAGQSGQRKIPGQGPRCNKATNAAVWALGAIDRPLAIGQLAILRSRIKNKAVQKQIDKAMYATAERLGVSPDEVEELAVPTFGLTDVGKRVETLGEFTAVLEIVDTTATQLTWLKPDGKPQKSVPKSVKDNHAEELKDLKAAAKDIKALLPAQRNRLDTLYLQRRSWDYTSWTQRYLNHPLVGALARRLIWTVVQGDEVVDVVWFEGHLCDVRGNPAAIDADRATVTLWHPIGHDQATVMAWRELLEARAIVQPFKQAHREVYLLTDAERNTRVYSNRYAAHILKQHQYNALCHARGWQNMLRLMVDDEYKPTSRVLEAWNLRAEFWVEGAGEDINETGVYLYLATDQVRFYPVDAAQMSAHACGGGFSWSPWRGDDSSAPIPITVDEIPPLVFSEVMRDVDLFVGVASVGNDPRWADGGPEGQYREYWHDYSFGELSVTAGTRKQTLESIVPKLKIADRCSFEDRFLVVRGDLRTYKIHLGSSNILMEPNDQYLCIVPSAWTTSGGKIFIPFEGDRTLSIILSKALMLADDRKIKDSTIVNQIKRQ